MLKSLREILLFVLITTQNIYRQSLQNAELLAVAADNPESKM